MKFLIKELEAVVLLMVTMKLLVLPMEIKKDVEKNKEIILL